MVINMDTVHMLQKAMQTTTYIILKTIYAKKSVIFACQQFNAL